MRRGLAIRMPIIVADSLHPPSSFSLYIGIIELQVLQVVDITVESN